MTPKITPADFLRSRPPSAQHWLDTFGSSMSPFLRSGDALLVERGAAPVAGDIAILARADGALIAHLVTRAEPLRTTTLLGFEDAAGLEPLGKAVRARVRGREFTIGPALRKSLLASHQVLRVGRARLAVHRVLAAPGVRALRHGLLKPEVRLLDATDSPAALRSLGDLGAPLPPDVLRVAFSRGIISAAVSGPHILGLCVLLPARDSTCAQLSMTGLKALGRGLDLEPRMVALALAEAAARFYTRVEVALAPPELTPALEAAGFVAGADGALGLDLE